ncbi:cobyrinic acid a,c-diamide synthase [Candidatus Caldarchaeum subterraneum]|nr:cobyrinic acid a,c-diamide synthase [Candidatus Caldarchaeum subterraneum]
MSKVVSFINYKGGVGKTTLAVEIAAALAYHRGKKVLLVDADPQTNATFYLISEEDWDVWQKNKGTLKNIFDNYLEGRDTDINELIIKDLEVSSRTPNLHLLPSHIELIHIDLKLAGISGSRGIRAKGLLKKALEKVKQNYDYVIIDCPPNLNLVTQNSIVASDSFIIVLKPEFLSTIGIALILRVINDIVREINDEFQSFGFREEFTGPEFSGMIFNFVKYLSGGTRSQEVVINEVKRQYPGKVFKSFLSESVKLAERPVEKIPISISGLASDRNYENQLKSIVEEFLQRV